MSSISTGTKSGMLFRSPLFLPSRRPRLLLRNPLFLLCENKSCYSDILYFYLSEIRTAVQRSCVITRPMNETAIKISSISTWQKSRLLFKYLLFIPDTNQDCCLDILCSNLASDQDSYSDILCLYLAKIRTTIQISSFFNLTKIRTTVQISSIPTWPKTMTAIQISSISTLQK